MTTSSVGSGFRAGMLERLFARADADRSATLDADELEGLMAGDETAERTAALIARHDQDGDEVLSLAEITGASLAPETLSGLLAIQEYAAADRPERLADDRKAVESFFAQADLDGDGTLSREEYDAGRMMSMAEGLDTGADAPQHMFMVSLEALADGTIAADEIMVARRLMDVAKPLSLDDPDLDPEVAEILKALPRPETPAEPQENGTSPAETVKTADFTQALIERLIRQLERAQPGVASRNLTV